jgi:hypothetical protein
MGKRLNTETYEEGMHHKFFAKAICVKKFWCEKQETGYIDKFIFGGKNV